MYDRLRPLLFALNAENAHRLSLSALDLARRIGATHWLVQPPESLPRRVFGIDFPNPVGLAAGLDKNGEYLDALATLGFGFIEIGTVTPRPQAGKPKPRLFRLPAHEAIINRMGFNNAGVDALVNKVEQSSYQGVLGINIGRNFDTPNDKATDDYIRCLRRVYPVASYVTVNISSPNTEGLRDLQEADTLRAFLATLRDVREMLATRHGVRKPLLLKIAPDLDEARMDAMAAVLANSGLDGLICTNTTLARDVVADSPYADEAGGLSGRPLRQAADRVLRGMHERLGEGMPIVGVGGIMEGADAAEKLDAGASLVQIYSGLIYRGPWLVTECVNEIRRQLDASA